MTQQAEDKQKIDLINVEDLLLDYENPRLRSSGSKASQEALLQELYTRYNLDGLIWSLAENGYFSEEPLIGVQRTDGTGRKLITVVEGNRRLAALKILLSESDRKNAGAEHIPEPSPKAQGKLNPVPVKIYPSRAEIVPYMGVRHIVGVQPWGALSKARYIKYLVDMGFGTNEVKGMVGIRRGDVVQRWLLSLYVAVQANSVAAEPWHLTDEDFYFSFLYTSLGYRGIRQYLEIGTEVLNSPQPDPVPTTATKNLIDHMADLYGTPSRPDVRKVKESREIRMLAAVYESPDALYALRAGAELLQAYRKSAGEARELVEYVRNAAYQLDQANAIAPHHKKNPEAKKYALRCSEAAQRLVEVLED